MILRVGSMATWVWPPISPEELEKAEAKSLVNLLLDLTLF